MKINRKHESCHFLIFQLFIFNKYPFYLDFVSILITVLLNLLFKKRLTILRFNWNKINKKCFQINKNYDYCKYLEIKIYKQ
jgi:hypothetical protein